jgi:hypothetical protein
VGLQALENKALSRGIIGNSAPILAEITIRKSQDQNYTVQELVLARQPQVPDDAAVVIVAGPQRDLLESETEALSTFLGRGGHLFVMLEPETVPGLVAFVKRDGIEVGNDVVIETNPLGRLVGGDYLMPVVMTYERHAITKELGNVI